jgi:hypothetical protein
VPARRAGPESERETAADRAGAIFSGIERIRKYISNSDTSVALVQSYRLAAPMPHQQRELLNRDTRVLNYAPRYSLATSDS